MKPTLNLADIKLLKGTFATKDDLKSMEKRQNQKFATKQDLEAMEKRFNETFPTKKEMESQFENLAVIIADSFAIHEKRISKLEQNAQVALI